MDMADAAAVGRVVLVKTGSVSHSFNFEQRFVELMFQQEGLEPPVNLVETTALLFITRMLQQSDMVTVLAADVAHYYAEHGMGAVLPIELPCKMDSFGLITRSDRLLSPGGKAMLAALSEAALTVYGVALDPVP